MRGHWHAVTRAVIIQSVIRSFADGATGDLFNGVDSRRARKACPVVLWPAARRKLDQINRARDLRDLAVPPGNRLEALQGDRRRQFSVRINAQYRICFRWEDGHADNVEVTDYH
jgi:proteic killer suppression protein